MECKAFCKIKQEIERRKRENKIERLKIKNIKNREKNKEIENKIKKIEDEIEKIENEKNRDNIIKKYSSKFDSRITEIWKNKNMRWEIIIIIFNLFLSILCSYVTKDLKATIIFVILSAIVDISIVVSDVIHLDTKITIIFHINRCARYIILLLAAVLPTIFGMFIFKEIKDFKVQLYNNLIPNIFGALIVCSAIDHIQKFGYKDETCSLMRSKRGLYNFILRSTLFGCYINAANYKLSENSAGIKINLEKTNFVNSLYLFIIIFYGVFAILSFALRIIGKKSLTYTIKEIYPTGMLVWGGAFLASCGILTLKYNSENIETILLLLNTATACILVFGVLFLFACRNENRSNSYPICKILVFTFFVVFNAGYCFYQFGVKKYEEIDIMNQIISGCAILFVVIFFLAILIVKQKLENGSNDRKMILLKACRELFQKQQKSSKVLNILEQTVNYNDQKCNGKYILEIINSFLLEFEDDNN